MGKKYLSKHKKLKIIHKQIQPLARAFHIDFRFKMPAAIVSNDECVWTDNLIENMSKRKRKSLEALYARKRELEERQRDLEERKCQINSKRKTHAVVNSNFVGTRKKKESSRFHHTRYDQ